MRFGIEICLFALAIASCNQAQMGGSNGTRRAAAEQQGGEATTPTTNDDGADTQEDDLNSPDSTDDSDERAIGKCLEKFGNHPFGDSKHAKFRKISASVQVLGIGNAISDKVQTDEPSLILVSAAVNVLGSPKYELLNPNGWYCVKVGVNVKTNLTVQLACEARLADNRVNVGVLSDAGETTAAVGVDVLSDIKVNRVGSCD